MSYEQEPQTTQLNDDQNWGRKFLMFQGMMALFGATLVVFNITPIVPAAEANWLCIVISTVVGVGLFVKNRLSAPEATDSWWWLVPGVMLAEAVLTGAFLIWHLQQYTWFVPLLLAVGLILASQVEKLAYWRLYSLSIFTGFLIGSVNTVAASGVGLLLLMIAGVQIVATLIGYNSSLFSRKQLAASIGLTVVACIVTAVVSFITLFH